MRDLPNEHAELNMDFQLSSSWQTTAVPPARFYRWMCHGVGEGGAGLGQFSRMSF